MTAAPDPSVYRPDGGGPSATGETRHLEELQVVVLKLSGLRCSLQVPADGPPYLSICRPEAVRMRRTVWCERTPRTASLAAELLGDPLFGDQFFDDEPPGCCSPSSTDTSCGFVWEFGPIAPAHEVFEAAIVIINTMAAAHPSGGPATR
ncbi:hypothetical protein AB0J52_24285 [Spirillospora sp. NPDC049652]